MEYRNELLNLLKYCSESANFITSDDSTEDKYAKSAYMDVIAKIGEIFEREQEILNESAALPLHGVINWAFLLTDKPNYGDEILIEHPVTNKKELLIFTKEIESEIESDCKWALITPCL